MGTHPIFESDFDCLTDKWPSCPMSSGARFSITWEGQRINATTMIGVAVVSCQLARFFTV